MSTVHAWLIYKCIILHVFCLILSSASSKRGSKASLMPDVEEKEPSKESWNWPGNSCTVGTSTSLECAGNRQWNVLLSITKDHISHKSYMFDYDSNIKVEVILELQMNITSKLNLVCIFSSTYLVRRICITLLISQYY